MKKLTYFLIIFLFFSLNIFSQTEYEYFGALKLNGDAKSIITYRLVFKNLNGKLSGYSITDIGGKYETKNTILGSYDKKTKQLLFKEADIIYTKSDLSANVFCFVNFSGKVNLGGNSKVEGSFKGLYKNNLKCIDGTISLIGLKKIVKTMAKYSDKVKKSDRFDTSEKEKIKQFSIIDSLSANKLSKGENLNLFASSAEIEIEVWDAKIEDGDRIDLFLNNRKILDNLTVTSKKKVVKVKLDAEKNVFRIVALNEGDRKSNTAMVRFKHNDQSVDLTTNLIKGENATITIIKK